MSAAVAAILEGMPGPRDLRLHHAGGRCLVTVGRRALFDYDAADVVMRNVAICALRQLGFPGRRVAAVFGLTENYVATLHAAALREGSVALARGPRPGVANTTVMRRLGPRRPGQAAGPAGVPEPAPQPEASCGAGLVPARAGLLAAGARII